MRHDIPTYSLILSPILDIFQQKPNKPLCCPTGSEELSNIAGLKLLAWVVRHINNNITTNNDGKSNSALIPIILPNIAIYITLYSRFGQ